MQTFISVIVPHRPNDDIYSPKKSFLEVDYPKNKKEIIFIKGHNPSQQRNKAIKKAKGNILVFVDNDTSFPKNHFKKIVRLTTKFKNAQIFGGPVLLNKKSSLFEKSVQSLMQSFIFSAYANNRYKTSTNDKKTKGVDLILCNMITKKEVFKDIGFFDEIIYPQEEVELLERARKENIEMVYAPELFIYKPQRKNLFEFIKMLFHYGLMRAKISKKVSFNLINILPSLFLLYIVSFLLINNKFYFIPLFIYIITTIVYHLDNIKRPIIYLLLLVLQLIGHLSYGTGYFLGVLKVLK